MDYKKLYASKLCTAKEAVKDVTSGDWVDYGWCTGHPVALDKALAERMPELEDVKIRGGIALWRPAIFDIENPADHFCWNSWHMSGIERKAVNEGFAFYAPIRYSELPRYYAENVEPIHVAMFQVAPMDEHGFFNFGPSASHMASMCKRAQIIVVEVNQNMPRCLGGFNEGIHISQVTHIVEGDNPPIAEMGARLAYDVFPYKPDIIIMQGGANDFLMSLYPGARVLAERLIRLARRIRQQLPDTKIYIESMYPAYTKRIGLMPSWAEGKSNKEIQKINTEIQRLCKEDNFEYVDVFDKLIGEDGQLSREYTVDGIHLQENAYDVVAAIIYHLMEG